VVVEALGALVNLIVVGCLRKCMGSQGALELALGMLCDKSVLGLRCVLAHYEKKIVVKLMSCADNKNPLN